MQPWYTSDISIVKSFKIKEVSLKVTAEINNVFDQAYDVVLNYPMPMRNYRLGIAVEL